MNDKDIVVEWWHDDKKIVVDGKRYKEEKVGRKRRLGEYSVAMVAISKKFQKALQ